MRLPRKDLSLESRYTVSSTEVLPLAFGPWKKFRPLAGSSLNSSRFLIDFAPSSRRKSIAYSRIGITT